LLVINQIVTKCKSNR